MGDERTDPSRIFISYRRDDSAWCVTALMDPLRDRFGDRIFKDTDNIAPGQDFLKVINRELESCSVLLAVIGRDWLSAKDKANRRRLDNPNDYLRLEIGTALKKDVLVIPVLVGAEMPSPDDLPEDLKPLSFRQSVELSNTRFQDDVQRLIRVIDPVMGVVRAPAPPPPAAASPVDQPTTADDDLGDLLERRRRQIEDHVTAAQAAFDADDFELVQRHATNALILDPRHADARELARRAKTALVEQKIRGWLERAQASLRNTPFSDADLGTAADLIDRALAENPAHAAALKLRTDVWALRRTREHERDVERQVREALARAQAHFDEEDFDAAIERCDDALAQSADCGDVRALRAQAVAAKEKARQARRAQQAIKRARAEFEAGRHDEALARLEQFAPAHELATEALEELRRERLESERLRREEERREQDVRRRQIEAAAQLRRQIGDKLNEAAGCRARREFATALRIAREAVNLDPTDPEARAAAADAEQALARQQDAADGLRAATEHIAARSYDAALALLDAVAASDPEADGLAELRQRADVERAAERISHELDDRLRAGREALGGGDFHAALRTADEALTIDAMHAGAAALKREAEAAIANEREEAVRREAKADARRRAQERASRKAAEDARRRELEAAQRRAEEAARLDAIRREAAVIDPATSVGVLDTVADERPRVEADVRVAASGPRIRIGFVAVAVAAVVAISLWLVPRQPAPPPLPTPVSVLAPGTVALNIAPWATIESITRKSNGAVIGGKDLVTPCVVTLPPGDYHIKATNPGFLEPLELDVNVTSGTFQEIRRALPGLRPDEEVARLLGKP